jgi:hypothetical protein
VVVLVVVLVVVELMALRLSIVLLVDRAGAALDRLRVKLFQVLG